MKHPTSYSVFFCLFLQVNSSLTCRKLSRFKMESDDENLVIEQQQLNISDESLPGEALGAAGGGGGGDSAHAPTIPLINHNLMESEWDTFQSSIARQVQTRSMGNNV